MLSPSSELAICGGVPAFKDKLHVGRPNVGDRDGILRRVGDILDRRWFTNSGPFVREFERRVADFVGIRHCVAMCNATVALEIAIRALGLTGEVIVPSFTFVATAHALQWQEITPVFCDINPQTHNIDPARVEEMITPRTTGIIGVHVWGRVCDVDSLEKIAQRRRLRLMFDAAHAFGCSHQGQMVGNFGEAEVYSFHATKFLNTFEGGAVVTNNDDLAAKMRLMKNFGFGGMDEVTYIGTNGKMTEVCAAMGLAGLDSLQHFVSHNQQNHEEYRSGLTDIEGLTLIRYNERERQNFQYVVVEVDERAALSRDELVDVLWAENVLARRYFYPGAHQMEPYRSFFPHASLLLPNTVSLCRRVLVLPTGTAIGVDTVRRICRVIRLALGHPKIVRESLLMRGSPPKTVSPT